MAIGSAPEIGGNFGKMWGQLLPEEKEQWFSFVRANWVPNLMAGYGTLVEVDRSIPDDVA